MTSRGKHPRVPCFADFLTSLWKRGNEKYVNLTLKYKTLLDKGFMRQLRYTSRRRGRESNLCSSRLIGEPWSSTSCTMLGKPNGY